MLGTKVLEERSTKYNKDIKVIRTWGMGTYIQVNGLTQSGGIVESIWKSTLKKLKDSLPAQAGNNQKIKNILILGLGGGTLAKLLRKKYPDAEITGVEIDPVMVELGRKYLDLDKYDVDVKIADASKWLTDYSLKSTDHYDLAIVDTYLGDNYVELPTFNSQPGSIWIFNRLYYGDKKQKALEFEKKLRKIFKSVEVVKPVANIMFICEK
jgi:spermidine synthase